MSTAPGRHDEEISHRPVESGLPVALVPSLQAGSCTWLHSWHPYLAFSGMGLLSFYHFDLAASLAGGLSYLLHFAFHHLSFDIREHEG